MMGQDPSGSAEKPFSDWSPELRRSADPYLTALRTAIETGKLEAEKTVLYQNTYDGDDIDWQRTLIAAKHIEDWLRALKFPDVAPQA